MHQRPKQLLALSILLVSIAVSLPLQILVMFGHAPWEVLPILSKLTPLNWVVLGLCLANSYAIYQAAPISIVLSPILIAIVGWNNWLVASVGINFSTISTVVATLLVGLGHSVMVQPRMRKLLTHPEQRWWLTPPRKLVTKPATICPTLGGELHSKTYDLSKTGAFISLDDSVWAGERAAPIDHLSVGSHLSMWLRLDQLHVLKCTARVVRQAPATTKHPSGFAVRFVGMEPTERRMLSRFLKHGERLPEPIAMSH